MLYRFSICRKGPPPCRFKPVSEADTRGARMAAELHLGNFRAAQLGFALPLVLPSADRNSSSGNLILCGASGLVGWDLQKNQLHSMNTPTNPSPPSLQPRQTRHHSHTAQLLSCSFKPAAPIRPGAGTPQNQNSSSEKLLPFKPTGLQVWWAGVCRHSQDTRGGKRFKPQPTTCAAPLHN